MQLRYQEPVLEGTLKQLGLTLQKGIFDTISMLYKGTSLSHPEQPLAIVSLLTPGGLLSTRDWTGASAWCLTQAGHLARALRTPRGIAITRV